LSKLGDTMPAAGAFGPMETALIADLGVRIADYTRAMEGMEVRKAAAELRAIWVIGNEYLQAAAPWSVVKTDPDQAQAQIRLALNLIRIYAVLSSPFIPDAAQTMMTAMGSDDWTWPSDVHAAVRTLPAGHSFAVPENLFRKITDEERADWQARFAGIRT
jgi:methionyl-tRNA synthetase